MRDNNRHFLQKPRKGVLFFTCKKLESIDYFCYTRFMNDDTNHDDVDFEPDA